MIRAAEGETTILPLSDINMPGMSGLGLLPHIKAERPDIPVLMLTSYGDGNTRKVALERGADRWGDWGLSLRVAAPFGMLERGPC